MRKKRVSLSSLGLGLAWALAWYLVLGFAVSFQLESAVHVYWGRVTIAALISFVVGWGLVQLIGELSSERRKKEDPQ